MVQYRNIPNSELTYGNDCPYIDIQYQKGRIFISNAVFRLLDKPGGIRLLWNPAKGSLLIKPTTIDDLDGFPVIGTTYVKNGSLFIGSRTLIHKSGLSLTGIRHSASGLLPNTTNRPMWRYLR